MRTAVRCDVNELADIETTIETTRESFGGLDILVNNADVVTIVPSVFRFSRAAHPHLVERDGGKIINIGSMYSIFGSPLVASYASSKGGVVQLTKSLAVAWAKQNIQVNAILSGWVRTDMTAPLDDMPEMYNGIIARTPAGRFAEPEECAGTAIFLALAASDFVTGQSVGVCGGRGSTLTVGSRELQEEADEGTKSSRNRRRLREKGVRIS